MSFILTGFKDLVVLHNEVVTVGTVIEGQRKEDPTRAQVCYHDLQDAVVDGCLGAFTLKMRHEVAFRCVGKPSGSDDDSSVTLLQSLIAGAVPVHSWNTEVTTIVWVVKWSKKGLMPVAPRVMLTQEAEIEVGHGWAIAP